MMTFGQRVKARREELEMTQEELANKIGYKSRASINKIELGKRNMKQSQIAELAKALRTTPAYLMGWQTEEGKETIPSNVIVPAAYAVPILGTICCGDGVLAEQNYEGEFFVDRSIRADYCVNVKGDSMESAEIYDGDIAFLQKDYDFIDGRIYGVVFGADDSCVLKRVSRSDGHVILQPCNPKYNPIVLDPDEVLIIGILCGVYHKTNY